MRLVIALLFSVVAHAGELENVAARFPIKNDVRLAFVDGLKGRAATCSGFNGIKLITVDETWWKYQSTSDTREAVIFHEMGHCVLGRTHDNRMKDGCAVSVMHETAPSDECWRHHRESYIKDLLKGSE